MSRSILMAGALLAATGVALGAFGAHGLSSLLGPRETDWWQTAVQYQMWHAIALVAMSALQLPRRGMAALLIASGVLIFSGSLYLMAITGMRWLGAVTPVGGASMIAGWIVLAWNAGRAPGR